MHNMLLNMFPFLAIVDNQKCYLFGIGNTPITVTVSSYDMTLCCQAASTEQYMFIAHFTELFLKSYQASVQDLSL